MSADMRSPLGALDVRSVRVEYSLSPRLELVCEQAVLDAETIPRDHHGADLLVGAERGVALVQSSVDGVLVGLLRGGGDDGDELRLRGAEEHALLDRHAGLQ